MGAMELTIISLLILLALPVLLPCLLAAQIVLGFLAFSLWERFK